MAVFPPTAESTMARREVGICTTRTPRMLERVSDGEGGDWRRTRWPRRSREIADDAAPEGEDDGVAVALLGEEKVFYGGLSVAGL